jgi:phosphatidate cytidylyltransferase
MKRVLTALVLIPLVLALVFLGPKWLVALATAVVAMLAAWEYMGMAERGGAKPPRIATLVAIASFFMANFEWPDEMAAILGILVLGLLIYCTFFKPVAQVMADASTAVFCLLYTGFTLMAVPMLREQSNGPSLVTFLLCAVWAGDIVALYVGKAFGRHKLAPSLSPNKTWEGSLGSIAGSLLATGALLGLAHLFSTQWDRVWLSFPEDISYWMGLAVLVNVAAQVGDLAESALKRSVDVKDSGNLLPGHGGVLDRIDALLLAAPALWYAQAIHLRF